MDKHITDLELYNYLSKNSPEESNIRVSRHIAGCKECLERTKAVMYLKDHFEEEWDDLTLGSIAKLNKELNSIEKKEKAQKNKALFFGTPWSKIMAVAAALIIIIGITYFKNGNKSSNQYSKWEKYGVINSKQNLDENVKGKDLKNMVAKLAGTSDIGTESKAFSSDNLLVSDAADAIRDTFSLSDDDKKSMSKGMKTNSQLTYRKVLDIFNSFAGEIYSDKINNEKVKGSVAVNTGGKALKNMNVSGNLYIMQGVGNGEAALKNVNVSGCIYVLGGGESTVILDKSTAKNMIVNKADGKVRVLAKNGAKINNVVIESGAKLQNDGSNIDAFNKILVSSKVPMNSEIKLNGNFNCVSVDAKDIKITVEKGAVKELNFNKGADNNKISLLEKVLINKFTANAPISVKGSGEIKSATVNAPNVIMGVKAEALKISDEVKDKIFDDKGNPINVTDVNSTINNFADKYKNVIKEARDKGKMIVIEDYVFLPDEKLSQIACNATGKRFFYDNSEINGFGSPGRISDLSSVSSLSNEGTGIDADQISSYEGIEYFNNVQTLKLVNTSGVNLSPVTKLKNLKNLYITGYDLKNISFLSGLSSLEYLDIRNTNSGNNQCTGVEALKTLTSLKKIAVQNMDGLASNIYLAPSLEDVEIYNGSNANYSSLLTRTRNLKRLSFINNDFLARSDWKVLLNLNDLQYLYLSGGDELTDEEKKTINSTFNLLPMSQRSTEKYRSIENKILDAKRQLLKSSLPDCEIVYGQRDELPLPR